MADERKAIVVRPEYRVVDERVSRYHYSVSSFTSISPELSKALEAQSLHQHAVPAQEKTKQVRAIGLVGVAVALIGVVGCIARPESQAAIATICTVIGTIFAGVYVVEKRREKQP